MSDLMFILLSGGMDSAVLLSRASQFKDTELHAVSFNYGQKHQGELLRSAGLAKRFGVPHHILEINSGVFSGAQSSLVNPNIEFEEFSEGTYEELQARQGAQPTYVPNRNMLFLAMAGAYALSKAKPGQHVELGIAAHAGDSHNYHYPDCTPTFFQAMDEAFIEGTAGALTLFTPFLDMTKGDIVQLGVEFGTPFSQTLSCYRGLNPACGTCATCQERIHAFKEAGWKDPLPYLIDIDWGHLMTPLETR